MLLGRIVALSLLIASSTVLADTVDITLRDTSVQLQYKTSMGRDALGKAEFHAGVLYVDKNNLLGDFGLLVKDELGDKAPGFSVGVGLKGVIAQVNGNTTTDHNVSALALGAMVRYSPPTISRLGFVGQMYLSPNIITFGDADRYVETGARIEYEIIPQAVVYVGYRRIAFDLKSQPRATLDEGATLGVRMSF